MAALTANAPKGSSYKDLLLAAPLTIAVAFLAFGLQHWAGIPIDWKVAGLGALGWLVALALRGPVAIVAMKFLGRHAQTTVVASSGPLEEGVRLLGLLWLGTSLPTALSFGQGWAAIEVVFALVNGFTVIHLLNQDDDKSREARAHMEAQGLLMENGPYWGILERASATAMHVGFTLLIAAAAWLTPVMMVVHSAANLSITRFARRSALLAEGILAIMGLAVLFTGLWLHL
jgi:hypothetical protein